MSTNNNPPSDSKKFRERNNLQLSNANLYISNNNNPFLISPYSYPTNLAKQTQVQSISSIISSFIGDLSSIINLSTFTLAISTITSIPTSDLITISTSGLLVDTISTTFTGTISAPSISSLYGNFSSIEVGVLNSDITFTNFLTVNSTLNASSIITTHLDVTNLSTSNITATDIITSNINFSTLIGSTITATNITTSNINFSTLIGSTITANTMTVNNNLIASSINATSSITTQELIFSSLCMIPSTISSGVTTFNSSILICLNGSFWKIPIEPI